MNENSSWSLSGGLPPPPAPPGWHLWRERRAGGASRGRLGAVAPRRGCRAGGASRGSPGAT
eukprot:632036-Alexandrium_andersonii.AAC.1